MKPQHAMALVLLGKGKGTIESLSKEVAEIGHLIDPPLQIKRVPRGYWSGDLTSFLGLARDLGYVERNEEREYVVTPRGMDFFRELIREAIREYEEDVEEACKRLEYRLDKLS